jgi:hypothetical protein
MPWHHDTALPLTESLVDADLIPTLHLAADLLMVEGASRMRDAQGPFPMADASTVLVLAEECLPCAPLASIGPGLRLSVFCRRP